MIPALIIAGVLVGIVGVSCVMLGGIRERQLREATHENDNRNHPTRDTGGSDG